MDTMKINDVLKSKGFSPYRSTLFAQAAKIKIRFPKTKGAILRKLENMEVSTHNTLNEFILKPRGLVFSQPHSGLDDEAVFMLCQRWKCGIDILSRIADAVKNDEYMEVNSDLDEEDYFMLIGIWKEFRQYWIANLAWRISKNLSVWDDEFLSEGNQ